MSNHFSADNLRFPGDDTRLDLTDVYAFRSTEDPSKTVLIIDSNPTVRPPIELPSTVITSRDFHPGAVYRINVDNDGDAQADVAFTFTFSELEQARQAALMVLPDILRYDRTRPAAYPNGRTPTDDVYSMRFAWLSHGKIPPTGLKPHDDLLNEFPYLGLPNT